MVKHRFDQILDGLFYFFFVLLLLPTVVRAQETPLNTLEEAQQAKPAETVSTVQQAAPAQSPGLPEEHPRLFWIIPTYRVDKRSNPVTGGMRRVSWYQYRRLIDAEVRNGTGTQLTDLRTRVSRHPEPFTQSSSARTEAFFTYRPSSVPSGF